MPTNPTDKTAWKQYLVSVVTANMQGVKTNHPYMYFVPGGDDDAAKSRSPEPARQRQERRRARRAAGQHDGVRRPGLEDDGDLIVTRSRTRRPASFKDVIVLFIGAPGDVDAVKQALASSGLKSASSKRSKVSA